MLLPNPRPASFAALLLAAVVAGSQVRASVPNTVESAEHSGHLDEHRRQHEQHVTLLHHVTFFHFALQHITRLWRKNFQQALAGGKKTGDAGLAGVFAAEQEYQQRNGHANDDVCTAMASPIFTSC